MSQHFPSLLRGNREIFSQDSRLAGRRSNPRHLKYGIKVLIPRCSVLLCVVYITVKLKVCIYPSPYLAHTVVARVKISYGLVGGTYYLLHRHKKMEAFRSSETLLSSC
jgi:hypothetical protein